MYSPEKSTWLNPDLEYLLNEEIYEYDIKSAGLSLIKQFRLLDRKKIDELSYLDKATANIKVGLMQRDDKAFSRALMEKFAEMRGIFIRSNELTDQRIISVKKDAIFTVGRCDHLEFGEVKFVPKNTYSSYIRFTDNSNIEIYFGDASTDVKGMSDISLARHRLYLFGFISKVVSYLETQNSSVKYYLRKFIDRYRSNELEEAYYLEFNNLSATLDPVFNYLKVIKPLVQITLREMS